MAKKYMKHPFHGGVKKKIKRAHQPLIWENMLGTVFAKAPSGEVKYFDYDWDAARAWADVDNCEDLRIDRCRAVYQGGWPDAGKYALWGIRKTQP